jgi:hypothetical protein
MLIFNHAFIFEDEKIFTSPALENSKTILVSSIKILKPFKFQSPWLEMSQRSVRYLSDGNFSQQNCPRWGLEIQDIRTLSWESKSQSIGYTKGKYFTQRLLEFWIYHTFFPLQLTLARKHSIFHVASILLDDKAILFSAFSFGGKSTLTEYFLKKGHSILGDDTLAIVKEKDAYYALASYPFYRPYRETESLGKKIENFVQKPSLVKSMYSLKSVDKKAKISIKALKGIEKFKVLHHSLFIDFNFLKEKNFHFVTDFAKYIAVYEIEIPWDLERLEEVYQAILTHNQV